MDFLFSESELALTVEGPTQDPPISSSCATLFDDSLNFLYTPTQTEAYGSYGTLRPLFNDFLGVGVDDPSSPASSFDSVPSSPAPWTPDDMQNYSHFDDCQYSPTSGSPRLSLLLDFDHLSIHDFHPQPNYGLRERHTADTVAPKDIVDITFNSPNGSLEHPISAMPSPLSDITQDENWYKSTGRTTSPAKRHSTRSKSSPYSRPKLPDTPPTRKTPVRRPRTKVIKPVPGADVPTINGEVIVKMRVASDKCRAASARRRTKPPAFFCDIPECGGSFTDKHNFVYHILSHKGVMPHSCQFCGNLFTTKCTARRHEDKCIYNTTLFS